MNSPSTIASKESLFQWKFGTLVFCLGLVLYAESFFVPAVRSEGNPLPVIGWQCALAALSAWAAALPPVWNQNPDQIAGLWLSLCAGLINPVALVYIVLRVLNRGARTRHVLASMVLISIPLTWLALYLMDIVPLAGHIAWIAGLLLMTFRDFQPLLVRLWRIVAA